MRHETILSLTATLALILVPNAPAFIDYEYAIFYAEGLDDFSTVARDVNNKGALVGGSFPPQQVYKAWAWKGKYSLNLGSLGSGEAEAQGINDAGTVVGWFYHQVGARRAFVWTYQGGMIDLGTFGGPGSLAHGINNKGEVVGAASFEDETTGHAFIWDGQQKKDLGSLDNSFFSRAYGVNENSIVVGESENALGIMRPVMWKDGQIIDLGSFGNGTNVGVARAVNDRDQAVGYARANGPKYFPFLWEDGVLALLSAEGGLAYDINNLTQVVGVGPSTRGGFIWKEGIGTRYLNNLIPPRSNVHVQTATGINDSGMISAFGPALDSCQSCSRTFLLVPVIPQITLSDPVPGIADQFNTWTVTAAKPGAEITLAYSLKGGGTRVPGCSLGTAVLMLEQPQTITTATADANGEATFRIFVPAAAQDVGKILFQAVRIAGCAESNLSVHEF